MQMQTILKVYTVHYLAGNANASSNPSVHLVLERQRWGLLATVNRVVSCCDPVPMLALQSAELQQNQAPDTFIFSTCHFWS